MTIFGLTVGRNEEHRYLRPMLTHMAGVVDEHFFYDDISDDNTPVIAALSGCEVQLRPKDIPSFVENEGAFRHNAWDCFQVDMDPEPGDWVLVIDCDEVLVSTRSVSNNIEEYGLGYCTRERLKYVIENLNIPVELAIPEVFGFAEDGRPLIRMDNMWGTISAPRLFPYRPGGSYYTGPGFGVPAVPSYVMTGARHSTTDLALMHYGYANKRDQELKYQRYIGQQGHSNAHVESIISPPTLVTWDRPYVKEMRGDS